MTPFIAELKAALALDEQPRRIALDLAEFDSVELTKHFTNPVEVPAGIDIRIDIRIDIAIVTFGYSKHCDVVSLYLSQDGKFSVGHSTCVYTDRAKEQLPAYARALRFIERYRLVPAI